LAATLFARARSLFGAPAPEAPAKPAGSAAKKMAFHAVSIAPGHRCCAAANELRGERFLSRDAPKLPLPECDRTDCTCRYEHHDDRRKGPRRARDMGVALDGWVETENRASEKRGRRKTDQRK
jgi:hypothetical protein